jgi:membrane protein DedA with SNARE-associated domain
MMSASDRNLRFGWWSLLVFLSLGGVLETLHGFKVGWYVDVGNEMRRLMFTLAHAHGTALALVNIVAALTARNVENFELRASVSTCLIWSGILFPLGFFLGGIVTYGGDPGLGVWLVPVAALLLFYSVLRIALDLSKQKNGHERREMTRKRKDEW